MKRQSRVYILPTAFGYLFLSGALIMMLIGATYQNNLVNLLAFFMMSLVFISMVQTHNNLKDVELQKLIGENAFAHTEYVVGFVLGNPTKETRHALEVDLKKKTPHLVLENNLPLLAHGNLKLKVSYKAGARGKMRVQQAKVHTAYPLGLFRAWIWLESQTDVFIYPEPKKFRSSPVTEASEAKAIPQSHKGGDDFHGHRRYHVGDPFGHIDWKAHARGRPLLVKEFNDGAPSPYVFEWKQLDGLSFEERLSTLSYWIDDAAKRNLVFGLKMPGVNIAPAQGIQHVQRCLEALAVYEEDQADARIA
ncbi:MAG TPA: DUF58 domain-containing protein [Bdellovibrionales bacterium]|nr:DUF58 domain-containing protein [Bdellovibrionales bacterium]